MRKMKILATFMVILMLAVTMPTTLTFATDTESQPVTEEVAPELDTEPFDFSKPIRVGYYSTFTDFVTDIDSLNNKGYGYEVFEKMAEISDLEFEYVPINDSLIDAVNSGYVDIGCFNTKTEERAEEVLYPKTQFSKTYIALMTKDENILYGDLEAIDGSTVATYSDNIGTQNLTNYCRNNGISVDYVYGDTTNYTELDADFYITYSEDPLSNEFNNILNLGVYKLFPITSFENADLMEVIESTFLQVVYTEGNYFLELEEKYLADNIEINHRGLTNREVGVLQSRPLEVGYVSDAQPLLYTNDEGEAGGAMVDMLNAFADMYDFEINYHPYSLSDTLDDHSNYDLLLTIYGDGELEREHYDTTDSIISLPAYAQVKLDIYEKYDNLYDIIRNSPTIGTLMYQTTDYVSFKEHFPNNEFVFYDSFDNLLDDFASGDVDIVFSTGTATTYAELYLEDVERATISAEHDVPIKFYVNKDISEDYLPIFNIMIDRLSNEQYDEIVSNNVNEFLPDQDQGFLEFIANYWYFFALAAVITIAGFIAIHFDGQIKKKEALLNSYNTDSLTGLMAIQKFRETIDEKLKDARAGEYELISLDIDMFKTINTHFSTDRGTTVILALADSLKKAFANTSAIISRRTADQFLILRRVNEGGNIKDIYNRHILPTVSDNINEKYKISMSFGKVLIANVKEKGTAIIGEADSARIQGKSTHKTTFISFDDNMRKHYHDKINITFRMEQALKDCEFVVEYQPKIDFSTLELGGAEALVRWHPKMGDKIYPDEFIPVFEENGFVSYLDLYVLDEVCKFIKANRTKMSIPRISVNLSAHTVLADNIVSRISDIISLHGVEPEKLELELTESALESNTEKFLAVVRRLKKLGFAISIDDFGAGVSSLNRLSAVEADVLKLDKAFFDLKDQGGKSSVVVSDIIVMAKHLNMKVVAEGVETAPQALWLKGSGCDYAQGYYFDKPMSSDDFKDIMTSKKIYSISIR